MKKAVLLALLLTSCAGEQQTAAVRPDFNSMSKCQLVAYILSNPNSTPGEIAATMEAGRNNGCFAAKR